MANSNLPAALHLPTVTEVGGLAWHSRVRCGVRVKYRLELMDHIDHTIKIDAIRHACQWLCPNSLNSNSAASYVCFF